MTINLRRRLAITLMFAAAVSAAGTAIARADPPGYDFMDLDDSSAAVVHPPNDQTKARISGPTAKLSEDIAAAIASGAQPVGTSIILAYRGQLYIVPDKEVRGGKMAPEMPTGSAPRSGN